MKKNRILSIIAAAAVVSSLSASVFADDYSKSKIENSIALLTQNEEVKTYYDKITADMSWLRTTTDSFAIFDVTGDNIPELIVTSTVKDKAEKGGEYDKKLHKFYSLKGDKAEYMYSASMSCATIAPSIEGKKLKWVYDDYMLAQDDSGLTMNSEYGYMTFTDEKLSVSLCSRPQSRLTPIPIRWSIPTKAMTTAMAQGLSETTPRKRKAQIHRHHQDTAHGKMPQKAGRELSA